MYGKATLRHVLEGAQSNRPRNSHLRHANACIPICKLPMSVSSKRPFFLAHPSARKIWTVEWLTLQPRASDKITWSTHKDHKESGKGWNKSPRRQICETVSSLRLRVNSSSKSEVVPPKHFLRIAQILQQPKKPYTMCFDLLGTDGNDVWTRVRSIFDSLWETKKN